MRETKKLSNLMMKWAGHNFESSAHTTPEFTAFIHDFEGTLEEQCPSDALFLRFTRNHFCGWGFFQHIPSGKWVYFSIPDVRFFPDEWHTNILIRTAAHGEDYTGGTNHYTSLEGFRDNVEKLFER